MFKIEDISLIYESYSYLLDEFGERQVQNRYEFLRSEANEFIKEMNYINKVQLNDLMLVYSIMGYYSDLSRVKSFHKIPEINDFKSMAHEAAWLMRRKPFQLLRNDKEILFVNEQFVLARILAFLHIDYGNIILESKASRSFAESLFYHLKFRSCDVQELELMLIAHEGGKRINDRT